MAQAKVPEIAPELATRLTAVFPAFASKRDDGPEWSDERTFHAILADFLVFFSVEAPKASERQLRELGYMLVHWSQQRGPLENAVDTCFLEHLRQVGAEKYLRRHLAQAKRDLEHHA